MIPEPEARAKAQTDLIKEHNVTELEAFRLTIQADQMLADIYQVESSHQSVFVAGWRPLIGWVCGSVFTYRSVIRSMLAFVLAIRGQRWNCPSST